MFQKIAPSRLLAAAALQLLATSTWADDISAGPNGINALATGLTGDGVGIGQLEVDRPGDPFLDAAINANSSVFPAAVYLQNGAAAANANIANHPEEVAGIMISKDAVGTSGAVGIAPNAFLYSSAYAIPTNPGQSQAAASAQYIVQQSAAAAHPVRAINFSFGEPLVGGATLNGNSLLTQWVDYSARVHDTLYVIAGNEGTGGIAVPTDEFNGLTVSYSRQVAGVYRQVDAGNLFTEDAVGPRRSVDLVAPGASIASPALNDYYTRDTFTDNDASGGWTAFFVNNNGVAGFQRDEPFVDLNGNGNYDAATEPYFDDNHNGVRNAAANADYYSNASEPIVDDGNLVVNFRVNGTSFAAPHVTGTVAQLQQLANTRIATAAPRFDADSTRHEVMKAVLMNSADKIQDTGNGLLLGMQKTILDRAGNNWLASDAFTDRAIPLDLEMGTGQLNAARAVTQFSPGEYDSFGTGNVPLVAWDFGITLNAGDQNKYVFDRPLLGDSYISITLAWDRVVTLNDTGVAGMGGTAGNGQFDANLVTGASESFTASALTNMDLYLLPKGAAGPGDAIDASFSTVDSVEHIFFKIPTTAEYEFWVRQVDGASSQQYGVAWWAVPEPGSAAYLVVSGAFFASRRRRHSLG